MHKTERLPRRFFMLMLALVLAPGSAEAKPCGPAWAELVQGPKGGCYYINRNGNKTYVERYCCD